MKTFKLIAILAGIVLIPLVLTNCSSEEGDFVGDGGPDGDTPTAPTKYFNPIAPQEPDPFDSPHQATELPPDESESCSITVTPLTARPNTSISIDWTTENAIGGNMVLMQRRGGAGPDGIFSPVVGRNAIRMDPIASGSARITNIAAEGVYLFRATARTADGSGTTCDSNLFYVTNIIGIPTGTISTNGTNFTTDDTITVSWTSSNAFRGSVSIGSRYHNIPVESIANGSHTFTAGSIPAGTYTPLLYLVGSDYDTVAGTPITITTPPVPPGEMASEVEIRIATVTNSSPSGSDSFYRPTISNAGTDGSIELSICPTSNFGGSGNCVIRDVTLSASRNITSQNEGDWRISTSMISPPSGGNPFDDNTVTAIRLSHSGAGVERSKFKYIKIKNPDNDSLFIAGMKVKLDEDWVYRNACIFQNIISDTGSFNNVPDSVLDIDVDKSKPDSIKISLENDVCFDVYVNTADDEGDGTIGPVFLQIGTPQATKYRFIDNFETSPDPRGLSRTASGDGPYISHVFDFNFLYNLDENDFEDGARDWDFDDDGDQDQYLFYIHDLLGENGISRISNGAPKLRIQNYGDNTWQFEHLKVTTYSCKCGSNVYYRDANGIATLRQSSWPASGGMTMEDVGPNCYGDNIDFLMIMTDRDH